MHTAKFKKMIATRIAENTATGCWEWLGTQDKDGYGKIKIRAIRIASLMAHRLSYEAHVGSIPEGLQIDHLCRNRRCVNPAHLEPVTCRVNIRRGNTGKFAGKWLRDKTHCPQGHPYSGDNLKINPSGARVCRQCQRANSLKHYHSKKRQGYAFCNPDQQAASEAGQSGDA